MTIIAKFASKCPRCGYGIEAGAKVEWNPGQKAEHENCQAAFMARPAQVPAAPARIAIEDAGVYVLPDGSIAKVKANRQKTRTYALRWTPAANVNRIDENGEHAHGTYEYENGLVAKVAAQGRKMTLEEAKAFTLKFGECVRCGRTLTDPASIAQAMGPVCVKYFAVAA